MRHLLVAFTTLLFFSACNTQNAITENNSGPDKPLLSLADVIPVMQPATPGEKAEQEKFLEKKTKLFKSKQLASAYYVLEAQRNFNENKPDSAAYLFGRAWLMDSTNNDVYWGYGLVYGAAKDFDKALFTLYYALQQDKNNPRLLTDIATSHINRFYEFSTPDDIQQSRKLLEEASKLDSKNGDIYYKLAIACYYLSDYSNAWENLHNSIKQQEDVADKTFIAALLDKQKDPRGVYATAPTQ